MKLTPQNLSFKGYDAAPLKRIYLEQEYCKPFLKELETIGRQEGIDIAVIYDNLKWVQDDKTIVELKGKPSLIASGNVSDNLLRTMKKEYRIPGGRNRLYLTGGNTFIGKFSDGEKWLIAGKKNEVSEKDELAKAYGVKPENIHFLPQQNYHLDMYIRPVGYPFVLVNNPKLVMENINKLEGDEEEIEELRSLAEDYYNFKKQMHYCSYTTTARRLEALGFIPIPVAGDYGRRFNFMNAIVNKHKDGTISYITNSSKCPSKVYSSLEKMFADDLRKKLPYLKDVYFVSGGKDTILDDSNHMMRTLEYGGGGLHCMSMEEPNFSVWA